jgi:hypothetical protein
LRDGEQQRKITTKLQGETNTGQDRLEAYKNVRIYKKSIVTHFFFANF